MTTLKPTQIIRAVCDVYGFSHRQLMGREKWQPLAFARQLAMVLCRTELNWTLVQTGKYFGRDHGTVIHAETVIESLIGNKSQEAKCATERIQEAMKLLYA